MSVHKEKRATNLPNQKKEKNEKTKKKTSLTSLPNKSLTTTKSYCVFFSPSLFGCTQNTKTPIKEVPSSPPTMGCLLLWALAFHFPFDTRIGH
jgi:hypothetical protein